MPRRGKLKYQCPARIVYYSYRYRKTVIVERGEWSDGATGAVDIWSASWWVHDHLCRTGAWDDGSPCNNWQASAVIGDILRSEGRWCRAVTWRWATWLFGGGKCREHGMW